MRGTILRSGERWRDGREHRDLQDERALRRAGYYDRNVPGRRSLKMDGHKPVLRGEMARMGSYRDLHRSEAVAHSVLYRMGTKTSDASSDGLSQQP